MVLPPAPPPTLPPPPDLLVIPFPPLPSTDNPPPSIHASQSLLTSDLPSAQELEPDEPAEPSCHDEDLPNTQELAQRLASLHAHRVGDGTEVLAEDLLKENGDLRRRLSDAAAHLAVLSLQFEEIANSTDIPSSVRPLYVPLIAELEGLRSSLDCPISGRAVGETLGERAVGKKNVDNVTTWQLNDAPLGLPFPVSPVSSSTPRNRPLSYSPPSKGFKLVLNRSHLRNKETQTSPPTPTTVNPTSATPSGTATPTIATPITNNPTSTTNATSTVLFAYIDSNISRISSREIQETMDKINTENNKPKTQYNIKLIPTYTLHKTLTKILENDHRGATVLLHVLTNDGRFGKPLISIKQKLNQIFNHLKSQTTPDLIFLHESPPSLTFDPYPYNDMAFRVAKDHGISFIPTLVGELHLFSDGYHVHSSHRHLLAKSIAAGILRVDPHEHFKLPPPPLGPFGVWRYPHRHPLRPAPSRFWPPFLDPFGPPPWQSTPWSNGVQVKPTMANVARAPPFTFQRRIPPLMGLQLRNFERHS